MRLRKSYIAAGAMLGIVLLYLFARSNARDPIAISPEDVRQALHQLPNATLTYEAPYVNSIDEGYQFRFSTTASIDDIRRYYDPVLQAIGFSAADVNPGLIDEGGRHTQLEWRAVAGEWHLISMSLDNGTLYSYYVHGYFR